jgi:MFS family permease
VLPLTVLDGVVAPILARGLYAVFAAGFAPVMLAIVSANGGNEGRGRSLGIFNSTRAVGFAAGQLTVGALLGLLAPAGLYLVIAGVSLVSTVTVALVADPTPTPDRQPDLGTLLGAVRDRLLPGVEDRAHLRSHGLRWLYVALALRNMTVLGVMSLMPPYLVTRVVPPELVGEGTSELLMGGLLAINPTAQIGFMLAFGYLADAVGRKPPIVAGMAGSGGFALVAAAATLPAGLLARAGLAALAFVVVAASYSLMTVGALALIGDVAPAERESELMGLRSTAKGVGGVLGPPLLGAVATLAGYRAAFVAGSVLAIAAAGLASARLVESHAPVRVAATADD